MGRLRRLDAELVRRGLARSRGQAAELVSTGRVAVAGTTASKPATQVDPAAAIVVRPAPEGEPDYVSRGGHKLAGALDHWAVDVTGFVCVDVGASTGGFTDCLLQRGAAKVWALDVGHGQIDWKLRSDPRVMVQEGVNARYLAAADFPQKFDLAVCDASFISLTLLIPALIPPLAPHGNMILLVKPQFEVERGQVGKGGIVREPALHEAACNRVRAAVEAQGFRADIIESPILGAEGNREFLLYASRESHQ